MLVFILLRTEQDLTSDRQDNIGKGAKHRALREVVGPT